MNRSIRPPAGSLCGLVLLALFTAGCELPRALGDQNAVIVATDAALWDSVQEEFLAAMEPTIQTITNERPYRITHQDPTDVANWANLRRFRQVLAMGTLEDPWIQEAIDRTGEAAPEAPTVFQIEDVWARGQLVSVLLLSPEDPNAGVVRFTPELRTILDEQFRRYAQSRMFVSGQNTALADSLLAEAGFALTLPEVYRFLSRDSVYRFRNDNPSPAELIREIGLTWVTPLPEEDPTREELESWRVEFARQQYTSPQLIDTLIVSSYQEVEVNGLSGVQYQSAWVSPPDAWPAGGPFISRAIRCPSQDRLYYMDAWLYAPGRDKYEYMIQLETILGTFRCR